MLQSFLRRHDAAARKTLFPILPARAPSDQQSTSPPRQHRALDIPEVVEYILSYVVVYPYGFEGDSQPCLGNTFRPQGLQLRFSKQGLHARLVCKAWNDIVSRLQWTSVSVTSVDSGLFSLEGRRRLAYTFVSTDDSEPQEKTSLTDDLRHAYEVQHVGRLRELMLAGAFTTDHELSSVLSLSSMTSNLTLLDIQFKTQQTLDIQMFFASESSESSTTFTLPHLQHFMLRQVELVPLSEDWSLSKPLSALKSFCLNHVRTSEATLDVLIRNFCHIELQRLVLLSLVQPGSFTLGTRDQHLVITDDRLSTIASQSPRLKTIMINQPTGGQALSSLIDDRSVRETFPEAEEIAVSHLTSVHDPVPAIFKADRHLTRLEITLSTCWDRHEFPTPAFHAFLCSDKAQFLQELHAPMVKYDAEYLEPSHGVTANWTCRDLRLLALGFLPKSRQDTTSVAYSRNMFGFLTTTCPKLRYLEIERALMMTTPQSGLCFLSRLPDLEQLTLRTKFFYYWGEFDLTSKPLPPWWASVEPSKLQRLKQQDSLALCRSVSQQDPNQGHFGNPRGKRMLWKAEPMAIKKASNSKGAEPSSATAVNPAVGACWRKLTTICIQLDEELERRNDERNQLRARAIMKTMPHCQVRIEYVKVK